MNIIACIILLIFIAVGFVIFKDVLIKENIKEKLSNLTAFIICVMVIILCLYVVRMV